jgi:putative membrane protein
MTDTADPASNPNRFEVRVTADSHFAWLRTRFALENTMMAGQRTAVSLIGFGFAIVQFFERLGQMPGASPAAHPGAPLYLGLALILSGVVVMLIAIWQYWRTLRYLWGGSYTAIAGVTEQGLQSPLIAVTVLLTGIGLFAFFAVLFRLV